MNKQSWLLVMLALVAVTVLLLGCVVNSVNGSLGDDFQQINHKASGEFTSHSAVFQYDDTGDRTTTYLFNTHTEILRAAAKLTQSM